MAAVEPHHPLDALLGKLVLVAGLERRLERVQELVEDDAALAEPDEREPSDFVRAGEPPLRRAKIAQEG